MDIQILDVLIHGNMVGVRAKVRGTQSGSLMGIAATSKRIEFAIHSFHEFRDERIAKTWHLEDWLSVFHQLGTLPPSLNEQALSAGMPPLWAFPLPSKFGLHRDSNVRLLWIFHCATGVVTGD